MRAVLIEVDHNVTPPCWYAGLAGQRLWCQEAREMIVSDGWLVLPGQGIAEGHNNVILAEHAWNVREGEVALLLVEVEPMARQPNLSLAGGGRVDEAGWGR